MQSSVPVLGPAGKISNRPASSLWTEGPAPACLWLIGQMGAWTAGGLSILPAGRKTRALLAILALRAPRPVNRSDLADLLWSQRPEEQARASLRQEIHRLLEALQPGGGGTSVRVARDHLSLRTEASLGGRASRCCARRRPTPSSLAACLDGGAAGGVSNGVDPALRPVAWPPSASSLRDRARAVAEALALRTRPTRRRRFRKVAQPPPRDRPRA